MVHSFPHSYLGNFKLHFQFPDSGSFPIPSHSWVGLADRWLRRFFPPLLPENEGFKSKSQIQTNYGDSQIKCALNVHRGWSFLVEINHLGEGSCPPTTCGYSQKRRPGTRGVPLSILPSAFFRIFSLPVSRVDGPKTVCKFCCRESYKIYFENCLTYSRYSN